MRNLKKVLSVLLVVAMLATAMVPAFAAETASISADAKIAADIGMLLGEGAGVTAEYTNTVPTRIQAAILLLRLKGLDKEAAKFTGTANFADVKADDWFAPYAAYLKANASVGFQGDEKGNLNPDAAITAQEYYKVVLTALGYEAGATKDYDYAKTFEFAATKGLSKVATVSKFTVDSLAVATVEALKASVKGGTKTLINTLVEAGKVDAAKAEAAGIYKKLTQGFEVSNGAKTVVVKLNTAPADASKVSITLTRDAGLAVAATADFKQDATDKTKFTYTAASNLPVAEYKVAVKDDAADLGSKTFTTVEEKIKSIEIISTHIIRLNDTEGYVKYKVTNNYGEDVTKSGIATNIEWRSSLGNDPESDKGTLTVKYDRDTSYLGQLRDYTSTPIVITGYEKDSAVSVTKTLTVSNTVGDVQSIKILGIKNKDNKTTLYRGDNSNEFYLDYEIKDSNGDLITSYKLLSDKDAFRVYPNALDDNGQFVNPLVAAVEIVQDPNASKDALFKIRLKESPKKDNPYDGVGSQVVNFIAAQSGKTGSYTIEVKAGTSELASFAIQRPSVTVTPASGNVEIPFIAYDGSGNVITKYDDIYSFVTLRASHGDQNITQMRDSNGDYKLYVDFTSTKKDDTVTLTATVDKTFKYNTTTIPVKEALYPYEIASTSFDTTYLAPGATIDFAPDKFTINDKNGNKVDLKSEFAENYYIKAVATNPGIVGIFLNTNDTADDTSDDYYQDKAQGAEKIKLIAAATGSANITFTMYGPAGKIAEKIVTFRSVDTKDITSYGIEAISTALYSGYDKDTIGAHASSAILPSGSTVSKTSKLAKEQYRAEIKVRGYIGSQKVLLPEKNLATTSASTYSGTYKVFIDSNAYSVSDTTKFVVSGKYVYAIYDESGTANANAVVYVDNLPRPLSTAVTSKEDVPVVASISVGYNDQQTRLVNAAGKETRFGDGYRRVVVPKGADFFEMTASDFNTYVVGKRLTKFNYSDGTDTASTRSRIFFTAKDQFGKEAQKPTITLVEGTGLTLSSDVLGGTVASGTVVRLNASVNGVTKTITINVK